MEITVTIGWWIIPAILSVAWVFVPEEKNAWVPGLAKTLTLIPLLALWCLYLALRVFQVIGQ